MTGLLLHGGLHLHPHGFEPLAILLGAILLIGAGAWFVRGRTGGS